MFKIGRRPQQCASAVSSGRFRTQLAVIVITGSFKGLKDAVWLTDKILTADGWIWPKYHVRRSPAIDSRAFHIKEFDFCNEAFSLPKSTYELPTTAISSLFQEFWTLANVPWFREMFSWQETFGQLECDSNKGSRIINWWSLNEPFTPLMMLYTYFLVPILTCMLYNLLKCTLHLTTAKTEKMRYNASLRVVHILIHLSICYRFPN